MSQGQPTTTYTVLAHLQAAGFYEQPAFPEPAYTFKHALTQAAQLPPLSVAKPSMNALLAIESLFSSAGTITDIAHHYRCSGNMKSDWYLHLAGQQAVTVGHRRRNRISPPRWPY
jgi:hypothetical protein